MASAAAGKVQVDTTGATLYSGKAGRFAVWIKSAAATSVAVRTNATGSDYLYLDPAAVTYIELDNVNSLYAKGVDSSEYVYWAKIA